MNLLPDIKKLFAHGVECFPCTVHLATGKKHPRLPRWQDRIFTLVDALAMLKPEHNTIAIKTGPSKLFVLDCDCKPGAPDGIKTLNQASIKIPEGTPWQSTPSGGAHYFFLAPENAPSFNRPGTLGLDARGEGGLIFTGEGYNWQVPLIRSSLKLVPQEVLNLFGDKGKPEPEQQQGGPLEFDDLDIECIKDAMFNSKNGEAIKKLFSGDISTHKNDRSAADQALCNHLAYFTKNNVELMDMIFRESGLYREKWERQDYREATIRKAVEVKEYRPGALTLNAGDPARFHLAEPEQFQFIIPGLLAKGICGFIYGEGGAFKSLAALQLVLQRAICGVLPGQKWLDRFELWEGRSIFFSAEDVETDLHHRERHILSMLLENEIDPDFQNEVCRAVSQNCRIFSREQWKSDGELFLVDADGRQTVKINEICRLINEFKADLVILETASRIAAIDENDNSLAARLVGVLEEIRDRTGATVLVNDHSGKANRSGGTDTHGQNSLRGASAKMDNARWGLWFQAQPRKDGFDRLKIQNAKSFRCRRADSFEVAVEYPRFRLVEEQKASTDLTEQVIQIVQENPGINNRDLISKLSGKNSARSAAIKWAVSAGFITTGKEGYRYVEE